MKRQEMINLAAITAAMADGTGLARLKKVLSEPFFDVGIMGRTCGDICGRTCGRRDETGICGIFFFFKELMIR